MSWAARVRVRTRTARRQRWLGLRSGFGFLHKGSTTGEAAAGEAGASAGSSAGSGAVSSCDADAAIGSGSISCSDWREETCISSGIASCSEDASASGADSSSVRPFSLFGFFFRFGGLLRCGLGCEFDGLDHFLFRCGLGGDCDGFGFGFCRRSCLALWFRWTERELSRQASVGSESVEFLS